MPIPRGPLATAKTWLRQGLQDMLAIQTQLSVDVDGKVTRQQVVVQYDAAFKEFLAALFDAMDAAESNTAVKTRLNAIRAVLEA
ncbi:MAG: hypothetical protein K0R61_119 [Microvirga sp.]|jgi:hypothetical protein|nr:hypothetical protein [Microvirga sp.]